MSLKMTGAAWDARVSPSQKLVLLAITECSGGDGVREWWRRDDEKISRLTSLSYDRIDHAVHQLMRRGVLVESCPPIECDRSDEWYEVYPWNLPGVTTTTYRLKTREDQRESRTETVDNSGYVYIIGGGGYCKIGRGKDPDARLKSIRVQMPFELRRLVLIETEDYIALESELHQRFAARRTSGEWFALRPEDIERIRTEYGDLR